jgi:dipeptidyl aminopeptidase/acylaminoacyl peptidase
VTRLLKAPAWGGLVILVAGLAAAAGPSPRPAEEPWEKLPDGGLGRVAVFDGKGGVPVAAYVRKPAGDGPFPVVILLHGGGPAAKPQTAPTEAERARKAADEAVRAAAAMGRATHPPVPEFLARGWVVYAVDYRPNPRYVLDPLEWDDTAIAVGKARAFPSADPKRVAMFGGSHGGHVTARMATRVDLSAAIVCAPAGLDLIALARLADKGTPIGGNRMLVRQMEQRAGVKMADIEKDPAAYQYSSPLTEAAAVRCPVLLISGRNDDNAPLPVMTAYADRLRAAGKRVEVYHPDDGPHGFYVGRPKPIPETAESTRRAVAFLDRHFNPAAP